MNRKYRRKVQYYETDQMGIVHHSNYIRWFEEARIDYLEKVDLSYERLESQGVLSPVLSLTADYLRMAHFGETMLIDVSVEEYNGIKLTLAYEVANMRTDMVYCKGTTKHCFINQEGRPLSLKQACPEIHEILRKALEEDKKKK